MTSKTKEFKLNEIIEFENEQIHFFNINPSNSSIFISLEMDGKKIKLNYSDKLILKDIYQKNESEEINYKIIDEMELKMDFKIINKFNKKDIFESFQNKMRESKLKWNQKKINEGMAFGTGISIKDRIKMFSGGDQTKKQNITSNLKPGKLKMPSVFQNSNKNSLKSRNSNLSSNTDKSSKKSSIKEAVNKEEIKDLNKIKLKNNNEEKDNKVETKEKKEEAKMISVDNKQNEVKVEEKPKSFFNVINEKIKENVIPEKEEKEEKAEDKEKEEIKEKRELEKVEEIIEEKGEEKEEEKVEEKVEENVEEKKEEIEEEKEKEIEEKVEEKVDEEKSEENLDEIEEKIEKKLKEIEGKMEVKIEDEEKIEEKPEEKAEEVEENVQEKENIIDNNEEQKIEEINQENNIENNLNEEENVIENNENNDIEIDLEKEKAKNEEQIMLDNYDFKEHVENKSDDADKCDEDNLYEEREYVSDENEENEEEEDDEENRIYEEDNNININNEIKQKENDIKLKNNNNENEIHDSSTFQKQIPGVNIIPKIPNNNQLQYSNTSKNFINSLNLQKPKGAPSFKTNQGDIFLESINYASYLKNLQKKGLKESKRETFCEGFFIASFPFKNASVIENSQLFPAFCGHEECSKLPSMKPEIIARYPLKDTKNLEMNNLAASICFPSGIKVCYSESKPYNIKDYVTPITNQKGERYYMMTHHFYRKISRDEYGKKYEMHPLKHHLMKFGDAYLSLTEDELDDKKVNEIQASLEFCQELGFRDYLYVPYCLCIISKYPYVNEMKKCLRSIYRILSKEKLITYLNPEEGNYEINNLIMHLIHSVPIPEPNSTIKFFLPYYNKRLEINCPKIEDISVMNTNTCTLLSVFSVEHIITIYKLILNEKKILFIDKYYERLAKVTDGFISLLYPLQWIHTYIPIMSDQMLKYLETFLPFLNGVHDSLMPLVKDIFSESDLDNEEVFLIYINGDKIKLGSSLNGKKMKADKYIQENIPPFPSDLEKKLKNKLKKMKAEFSGGHKKDIKMDSETAELKMRDTFIDFFLGMFHDYEKYLYLLDDEEVVFNKSLFLNNVPNNEKKFYNEIIDSQLFQQFTQNIIKEDFNYLYIKLALREKEQNEKKKKNKKKDKNNEEKKPIILNNYVVPPYYLNIKDADVRNIEGNLRKKFPIAIKDMETDRIMLDLAEIDPNKFINERCLIFLTPEQIKAEQGDFHENKNLDMRKSAIPKFTGNFRDMKLKMNVKLSTKSTMVESEKYNEKKKEEMKEYIRDYIAKIFRSEINNIDNTEKSDLVNIIETPYGREYFISLLSHNTGNLVLLQKNSFKLLGDLIYNTLIGTLKIDENDKVLEEIVLLIKSTKCFGMEEKGKTIKIYDDYKKRFQSTPKFVQYNFWKKKFDIDLKNKENKQNDNKTKQDIIYELVSEMIDLEIPKGLIKTIIDKMLIEIFGKDTELSKETFKVFIQQISKAHYISKARD